MAKHKEKTVDAGIAVTSPGSYITNDEQDYHLKEREGLLIGGRAEDGCISPATFAVKQRIPTTRTGLGIKANG